VPRHDDALVDWWLHGCRLLQADATPTFDSAILLVAWCLWKERNIRTFNRVSAGLRDMLRALLREAEDWDAAGFSSLAAVLPVWSRDIAAM
jgi:hypothetical protein